MKISNTWTAAFVPTLLMAASNTLADSTAEPSDMENYRGAILMANGDQTSCGAALIDSKAAVIAASCLTFKDGKVDTSPSYKLIVEMGDGEKNVTNINDITKITVHPKYDPHQYINNLAVVEYNDDKSDITWSQAVGVDPKEWNTTYLVRHSMSNVPTKKWNPVETFSTMDTPDDCSAYSEVYKKNKVDFLCNYKARRSIYNHKCRVPYGTVYSVIDPRYINIAAVYSHSVVVGGDICSDDKKLHYYTLLRNYGMWAAKVLNRPIGGFVTDPDYKLDSSYDYSMKAVGNGKDLYKHVRDLHEDIKVFTGDRYSQDPQDSKLAVAINEPPADNPSNTDSSSNSPTPSSSDSTDSTDSTDLSTSTSDTSSSDSNSSSDSDSSASSSDSNNNTGKKGGGISTGGIIAIVAVVLIIFAIGGVFWWWRRRRQRRIDEQQSQNGWGDNGNDNESITELPNGMRFTNNYANNQNQMMQSTNDNMTYSQYYGHDFGDREGDTRGGILSHYQQPAPAPGQKGALYGRQSEFSQNASTVAGYNSGVPPQLRQQRPF